ncbi:MAG: hypothetical protein LBB40_01350 [Holophagales bacterium]|jgi:hypothetical protein|nr:hypothetical protein [Holophagales bacterium]
MYFRVCLLAVCLSAAVRGYEVVGSLLYRTLSGRGITLMIIDIGPGMASFRPEQGGSEVFRQFVQKHCVRELKLDKSSKILKEPPPAGYIGANGRGVLVRTATMTYWRYAPELVLPVRFNYKGEFWELISANVPDSTLM